MLECVVMGDSIAVGVSQYRQECITLSENGINSANWLKKYGAHMHPATVYVISLGANDYTIDTLPNIEKIRSKVHAGIVFWLLPRKDRVPKAYAAVKEIAKKYGDQILERPKDISPDGIHPTAKGYKELADKTRIDYD
jgi:lysophospholipase L1-like esterase